MTHPHIFVIHADILNLNCHAWMLPTDARLKINEVWLKADCLLRERALAARPDGFGFDELSFPVPLPKEGYEDQPVPIAVSVPSDNQWNDNAVHSRVRSFAESAVRVLEQRELGRRRPLLAIPFFGNAGGAVQGLARQVQRLLHACSVAAEERDLDITLVFKDPAAYALAQTHRRSSPSAFWPELEDSELTKATRLGERAARGDIVPFLGAGVSVSAGAPSWSDLLDELTAELALTPQEADGLKKLNPLDRAGVIESFYSNQGLQPNFREKIVNAVDRPRYGLAPALLAVLPSEGAITLNYDKLFEDACVDAGRPRFVIPHEPRTSDRWLLKLHGSVKHTDSIVLTRDDYLGFNASREALSSLVKAHLITHHLLFVGFGLSDDHFYEIVHDVRRAVPQKTHGTHMGTALTLFTDSLQSRAWNGDLDVIPMAETSAERTDLKGAGRRLEIFLDAMMAYAAQSHRYLLADKYGDSLSASDLELRKDILLLVEKHDSASPTPAWERLKSILVADFGLSPR